MKLGHIVKALRSANGWGTPELARRASVGGPEVSYQKIQQLEASPDTMPRYLPQLASAFEKSIDDLLNWENGMPSLGPNQPDSKVVVRISGNETAPGYVRLPQIDLPAGAGPGAEVDAEPAVVRFVDVADQWASDNFGKRVGYIRVMTAKGDSMVAAGINSGDLLFVDTSQQTWDGDGFYIVQFMNGWQVKRLRADIMSQQLEIVSMPVTGAEAYAVPTDKLGELRIGGKVAAWWTLRHH